MGFWSQLPAKVSSWTPWGRGQLIRNEGQEIENLPRDQEKLRAGVPIPAFLPYLDMLQNQGETPEMRWAYRRMMADPTIKCSMLNGILSIMSLELKIHPASDTARDKRIADFVQWNLTRRIKGGMANVAWNILSAGRIDGISINEKVWGRQGWGEWEGMSVLRGLKMKDVDQDLVVEVDEFKNITGIKGLLYNNGQIFDPKDFVIYRNFPMYEGPAGISDLRAVYGRWWLLDTVTKLRGIGAEKIAHGLVILECPVAAMQSSVEKSAARIKSSSYIVVPPGVKAQVLDLAGQSSEWWASFRRDLMEEIFLGVDGATLQSMAGDTGQNRGSSAVHKGQAELRKWYFTNAIETILNDLEDGLIMDMVTGGPAPNFSNVKDYPWATLGGKSAEELAADLAVDTGLKGLGFKHKTEDIEQRYSREHAQDDGDALPRPEDEQREHEAEQKDLDRKAAKDKPAKKGKEA